MPLVWKVSRALTGILNTNSITSDVSAEGLMKAKYLSLEIWSSVVFTLPSQSLQRALAARTAQLEREVRGWGTGEMVWGKISKHFQCALQKEARRDVTGEGRAGVWVREGDLRCASSCP